MDITVTVTGLESIDKDLYSELEKIKAAAQATLPIIGREAAFALQSHIETDVYDADAYTPRVYKRRSEHPSLGRPLSDVKTYVTANIHPATEGTWTGIDIYYKPSGEHKNAKWSDADGNELIGRIEKKDPPYNWEPKNGPPIPPRPFWQNFVSEMTDGGKFAEYFQAAMLAQGYVVENDTGVEREAADGDY